MKQACKEMGRERIKTDEFVAWFVSHHETWAPSTVRQYRAALLRLVLDLVDNARLPREKGDEIIKKLSGRKNEEGLQISPRARRKSPRPGKLKNLSPAIAAQLSARCGNYRTRAAKLAKAIAVAGPEIGLRGCEWPTIELNQGSVRAQNAKYTNDRSSGLSRAILIPPQNEAQELWAALNEIAISVRTGVSWKNMQRRINYALKCASADIGLERPATLGTFRHVAIARWKCLFSADQVAALAGHASNATAVKNYARRRGGRKWPPARVKPDPRNLALVRDRFRSFGQTRNVAPCSPGL